MIPFHITEPGSLIEAASMLGGDDGETRPIAGGTALMLMMKSGVFAPTRLVSLRAVEKRYSQITTEADGTVRIGALTCLADLEHSQEIKTRLPVIFRTMPLVSNARVRNVATVGGCLAHGDPHMDLPPIFIALGARVSVVSPKGVREIPVEGLLKGYFETHLAKNELIAEVIVPPQKLKRAVYLKCTTRAAHDWPALGVTVAVDGDGEIIREANIVISAATERAVRAKNASSFLTGKPIENKSLKDVGDIVCGEVDLVGDSRGSAPYKQQLVRVFVERAIREALSMGGGR
jgi:aerobic carbon-monoxide dehydrogenase medium subunit